MPSGVDALNGPLEVQARITLQPSSVNHVAPPLMFFFQIQGLGPSRLAIAHDESYPVHGAVFAWFLPVAVVSSCLMCDLIEFDESNKS